MRTLLLTLALAAGSAPLIGLALAQTTQTAPATTPSAPSFTPSTPAITPSAPALTTPLPAAAPSVPTLAPSMPAATPSVPGAATPSMPGAATPALPDGTVVATVGTEQLTLGQFNAYFRQLVGRTVNAQGVPLSDDVLTYFNSYRPQILTQYARERAVLQLARAAGLQPDQSKADANFADARKGFDNDSDFADALMSSGFATPDALRAALLDTTLYAGYLDSIKGRFKFGDALVASNYALNQAKYTRKAQACVKHILVPTQAAAQAIAKQLSAGADFAALAKAQSKDPGSAAQGGDLGCLAPGETVAPFDRAAFNGPLNVPQVVQTEFGWHVLEVTRRTAAGVAPLSEVQASIRDSLSRDAAQKYLDSQITKVNIVTRPELVAVAAPAGTPSMPGGTLPVPTSTPSVP